MNPALTTALLSSGNSIENNALSPPDGAVDGLSNELFAGELSSAIEDILAVNGKLKPLGVAALKGLEIQDLTDLEELGGAPLPSQLLSEALELQQKQASPANTLVLEAKDPAEQLNIVGNPDALALLKSDVIDENFVDSDVLTNLNEKPVSLSKNSISDVLQQLQMKKEPVSPQIINNSETDFSKFVKELSLKDADINKELFMQTSRQETNPVKLVDQLASVDKSVNVINPVNTHTLKTYSNPEQTGTMLNRIEVPVTQAGWGEAVGNRLMMMVNGKMQSANIKLNPAELGPIEIRVNVNQDQQASVHFVSNNTVVRDAIEEAFPRLKEMFSQNGLTLNDANVSQQSTSQHGNAYTSEHSESLTEVNDSDRNESDEVQIENKNEEGYLPLGLVDQYV